LNAARPRTPFADTLSYPKATALRSCEKKVKFVGMNGSEIVVVLGANEAFSLRIPVAWRIGGLRSRRSSGQDGCGHPEEDKGARAGVLTVRTGKDCLLVAVNAKDEALLRYNGDHLGCESV
jgi:hypothetical protein